MTGRTAPLGWFHCRAMTCVTAAALGIVLLSANPAAAQSGRPLRLANVAVASGHGQPAEPNVFDRIARWFDRSFSDFDAGLKETFAGFEQFGDRTGDAVKDAAGNVAESAESLAALPNIRIVSIRQRCEPAANGAPDCRRAAEAACRSRGYATGKSLQTQSGRICALPTLLSHLASKPRECRTETHVLRSICQ